MLSNNFEEMAMESVNDRAPMAVIKSLAAYLKIREEARDRIEKEGIIVRDMKGGVIEHPAIKIEISATKMILEITTKYPAGKRKE